MIDTLIFLFQVLLGLTIGFVLGNISGELQYRIVSRKWRKKKQTSRPKGEK